MIRRLLLCCLASCLLLFPWHSAAADLKFDLFFKRWGTFYFPSQDWRLWKAQGQAESRLNPFARSPVGAMGVMQLMPGTAKDMGIGNPWDPEASIQGGVKYDRAVSRYFRTVRDNDDFLAFTWAGYNAGPGWIIKARKRAGTDRWEDAAAELPGFTGRHSSETINYVRRIRKNYQLMK